MCGIFCSVCGDDPQSPINEALVDLLKNRGPDNYNVVSKKNLVFGGFVLWQQGHEITAQPICYKNWILLLNGDIFNANSKEKSSDTNWLIQKLSCCSNEDEILDFLKTLKGPYSLIMYDCDKEILYFARDSLGRNSLLIEKDIEGLKLLSNSLISKSVGKNCVEVPPKGLFKLHTANIENISLYPWICVRNENSNGLKELNSILPVEIIDKCINPEWLLVSPKNQDYFDFYQLCSSKIPFENIYEFLLDNNNVKNSTCEFLRLLKMSVKERVTFTPKYCKDCIKSLKPSCHHSKIGILFSGGIDCTILAKIADEFIEPSDSIDLINVAFEAPNSKDVNWNVPDRYSAKESYEELKRVCPMRKWNLIEVNVPRKELNEMLETHIKHLIYPLNTVLDESLGCAFWFASRGQGICDGESLTSTSRIILIGSGADELFGGYTRHRNAFNRCDGPHEKKLLNLFNELEMDLKRLPSRNLGRDDRVIADNGRTSRAPFVQEDIIQFVRSLKPEQRCCFIYDQGVGDKLFLRLCGYKLGLRSSVKLRKRAIQFGSRIANKNQNAKDLSVHIQ